MALLVKASYDVILLDSLSVFYSELSYSINGYVTLEDVSFTTQNIWPLIR